MRKPTISIRYLQSHPTSDDGEFGPTHGLRFADRIPPRAFRCTFSQSLLDPLLIGGSIQGLASTKSKSHLELKLALCHVAALSCASRAINHNPHPYHWYPSSSYHDDCPSCQTSRGVSVPCDEPTSQVSSHNIRLSSAFQVTSRRMAQDRGSCRHTV